MARTSSSRRSNAFSGLAALTALLLGIMSLGLAGCGNDNPADNGGSMKVDLRGLISQMNGGGGPTTLATGVDESPATTEVKSMIIGAVVITFTGTPLSSDTNIDGDLEDKLADDVINSINFFSIVDLPTSESFVEFKVPPPGAGHWQVAAIGTRTRIATFEDLNDNNVGIYYGFTEQFFNTSGSSGSDNPIPIEMKRACFIDVPPKGCAAFSDGKKSKVTNTVEILDVKDQNGNPIGALTYPMYVRATGGTHTPTSAMAALDALSLTAVTEITVEVSHQDAPGQPASCTSVTGTGGTAVTNLRNNCGSSTFVTSYN